MDPCLFFRIWVGNLALKLPTSHPPSSPSSLLGLQQTSSSSSSSSTSSSYYCKIKLANLPLQITTVPDSTAASSSASACFSLSKPDLDRLILAHKKKRNPGLCLKIDVYRSSSKQSSCGFGFGSRKFVGRVCLMLDLGQEGVTGLLHNGWVRIGEGKKNGEEWSELYVSVKFDLDPRFVFEFDGEPERSPQVFQVQGIIKQSVFSCKFGFKNSGDWNMRSSSTVSEPSTSNSCWWSSEPRRSHHLRERKGWTVTIHDLSGSPVAAASMVTPFVPSPGSDRVSRSNPGAWLILRPADGTWTPWGRLEAWSHRSSVAFRFDILSGADAITLSSAAVRARSGGKFTVDIGGAWNSSPASSPNSSFDLTSWSGSGSDCASGSGSGRSWGPQWMYGGFVMSSTVGWERAHVQVGAQHVTCAEDAAAFVALAAAADLSVDACKPFSQKLRKGLRQPSGELVV